MVPLEATYYVYLFGVFSLLVPGRLVPQVGAHGYPADLCRLAPGVGCDPLQGARHIHHESPTTPTTASPRGSGTLYWMAPASSSGWSVCSGAPSPAPIPSSDRRGKKPSTGDMLVEHRALKPYARRRSRGWGRATSRPLPASNLCVRRSLRPGRGRLQLRRSTCNQGVRSSSR